jgi:hypothetical protein
MSNEPIRNHADVINTEPVGRPALASPVEVAGDLGSPFSEALNAFEARWDLFAEGQDLVIWEPDASQDSVSIGVARRDAPGEWVVRISLVNDHVIRVSALHDDTPLMDLAATSRVLHLPAYEVTEVLRVAADALRHMQTVVRLAEDLYNAKNYAIAREHALDRNAHAGGDDPAWLKDPQSRRAEVRKWEAARDRFVAAHGKEGVVASGLDDRYGLAMDLATLTLEQSDLLAGGLAAWLAAGSTPRRPSGKIPRLLPRVPRLVRDIAAYVSYSGQLDRSVRVAKERLRIADQLECARENLADAEDLESARADVDQLKNAVVAAVQAASTPVEEPKRPVSYPSHPAPTTARTQPPTNPTAHGSRSRRPGASPPTL